MFCWALTGLTNNEGPEVCAASQVLNDEEKQDEIWAATNLFLLLINLIIIFLIIVWPKNVKCCLLGKRLITPMLIIMLEFLCLWFTVRTASKFTHILKEIDELINLLLCVEKGSLHKLQRWKPNVALLFGGFVCVETQRASCWFDSPVSPAGRCRWSAAAPSRSGSC